MNVIRKGHKGMINPSILKEGDYIPNRGKVVMIQGFAVTSKLVIP